MKKIILFSILAASMLFVGCKNPLFNPKANAKISYFTDMSNVQTTSLTLSGAAPHSAKAFMTISNGVDTNFTDYSITFYDIAGRLLPLSIENKTTAFIAGSGNAVSVATGYVPINVTNSSVTAYKTANALTQLTLAVIISGEDINGNQIVTNGNFTIY